jgi:hypothetical protein
VCVRTHARPVAQRDARHQDEVRFVAGAGLADGVRGDDRGDGVGLDVLKAAGLLRREVTVVWLLNTGHISGPGRKSAVRDTEWRSRKLLKQAAAPSFLPP